VLDAERGIRQLNRAFTLWLNLDPKATAGKRLDNIMILRGQGLKEMWAAWATAGSPAAASARPTSRPARCAPPRRRPWRSPAASPAAKARRGSVVMFETLAGRQ
jgi:hypothetical protein